MKLYAKIQSFHRHPDRRPYWQMPMVALVGLLYFPAKMFCEWAENL